MLHISLPDTILPLFFQSKKRSRQEPQGKQDQSKRNDERDQQVLGSLHSRYSKALRKPKYRYNHHCQAQPDGQGGLNGSLKIGHAGIHASSFMIIFDFSRHSACSSFLLLLPIRSSEFFCIINEAIGQDEDVHRCCDKRCKEKKRWLVPHYAEQQFIDSGDDEKHEGHCRDPSEREQRSLEQSLSSGLKCLKCASS